jgi:hypothetical protein
MAAAADIEDYEDDAPEEERLTSKQCEALQAGLRQEGYYFSIAGLKLLAKSLTPVTPDTV